MCRWKDSYGISSSFNHFAQIWKASTLCLKRYISALVAFLSLCLNFKSFGTIYEKILSTSNNSIIYVIRLNSYILKRIQTRIFEYLKNSPKRIFFFQKKPFWKRKQQKIYFSSMQGQVLLFLNNWLCSVKYKSKKCMIYFFACMLHYYFYFLLLCLLLLRN